MKNKHAFVPPYRVGKNQGRVILDSLGHEVGIFSTGHEDEAQKYCDFLNKNEQTIDESTRGSSIRDPSLSVALHLHEMLGMQNSALKKRELDFTDFKKQFDESFSKINPVDFVAKMIELGYVFENVDVKQELTTDDYKEVIEDHKKLVKELDVALNGKDSAKNPSLCDIVSQVKNGNNFNPQKWGEFAEWISIDKEGWRFSEEENVWKLDGWKSRTTQALFEYSQRWK